MEPGNDSTTTNRHSHRLVDYKCKTVVVNQQIRRFELLQEQKRRREDTFNSARNLSEIFPDNEDEEAAKETWAECEMEWTAEKLKFPKLKNMFMFSEWMAILPDDLWEKWLFVLCPVGKRCLVRGSKGCTTVYGTQGHQLARFQSLLPSGGFHDHNRHRHSSSEVTILDCIWSSVTKKYYVLDILCWKGQSYLDTDTSFRNFWIKSKILEEMPLLMKQSSKNPYPFIPLEFRTCDTATISLEMSRYPYFQSNEPQIDGVLFYHGDACYTPGQTPLVVWLKPFMLPEILGPRVVISEQYFKTRPDDYVDMTDYIIKYEAKHTSSRKRKSRRRKTHQPDEEMEECDHAPEEVELELALDTEPIA